MKHDKDCPEETLAKREANCKACRREKLTGEMDGEHTCFPEEECLEGAEHNVTGVDRALLTPSEAIIYPLEAKWYKIEIISTNPEWEMIGDGLVDSRSITPLPERKGTCEEEKSVTTAGEGYHYVQICTCGQKCTMHPEKCLEGAECKPPCEEEITTNSPCCADEPMCHCYRFKEVEPAGGWEERLKKVNVNGTRVFIENSLEYAVTKHFLRSELATAREKGREEMADIAEDMWGLICNVNNGRVEDEPKEWYDAFIRIRAKYFAALTAVRESLSAEIKK